MRAILIPWSEFREWVKRNKESLTADYRAYATQHDSDPDGVPGYLITKENGLCYTLLVELSLLTLLSVSFQLS